MRTLLLSLILATAPTQAAVNAYLDRYTITEGNSFRLTLESDQGGSLSPDLSPLHKEFQILGSKKMSITSKTSDSKQSSARWQVLLRPKRLGNLKVPAIQVGSQSSSEMEVVVMRPDRSPVASAALQATLEQVSDTTALYQNSQMTLTVRLTDSLALPPESTLQPPQITGASVIALGNASQRQTVRHGQILNLMEKRFLVFPQQSGPLTLPGQTLVLQGSAGELREVVSEPLTIDVRPAPRQANRGYWLPASSATLTDSLQGTSNIEVGESVERTLTLTAQGIRADDLPALMPLKNELAVIDIIDIQRDEQITNNGLISTRSETVRITPLERGEITLPEITIPWWDTNQDRSQTLALPMRHISASPAAAPAAPETADSETEATQPENDNQSNNNTLWGVLALLALAAGGAFWFIRKRGKSEPIDEQTLLAQQQEENAFETLAMACHQTDPYLAQQALVLWAQEYWLGVPISNGADVARMAASEAFDLLIADLEQHMEEGSDNWQGDLLLQAVSTLREMEQHAA